MRRIIFWIAGTATVVVLMFAYHTSTDQQVGGVPGAGAQAPRVPGSSSSGTGPSSAPSSPSATKHRHHHHHHHHHHHASAGGHSRSSTRPAAPAAKTFTGQTVQTARGPVEVRVTVSSGRITNVSVPVHPAGDSQSDQINAYALPQLVQSTMSAQSSKIDMVSGATITSQGYIQSLQSALDAAGMH